VKLSPTLTYHEIKAHAALRFMMFLPFIVIQFWVPAGTLPWASILVRDPAGMSERPRRTSRPHVEAAKKNRAGDNLSESNCRQNFCFEHHVPGCCRSLHKFLGSSTVLVFPVAISQFSSRGGRASTPHRRDPARDFPISAPAFFGQKKANTFAQVGRS